MADARSCAVSVGEWSRGDLDYWQVAVVDASGVESDDEVAQNLPELRCSLGR